MPLLHAPKVEPLSGDLVTLAQCMAIDADAFPYDSVRFSFAARERSARALVARDADSGRVVGFIAGYVRGRRLHVFGIAVDRAARRCGVGRALLTDMIARASREGLSSISLQVSTSNHAAIELYVQEGFVVRRTLAGYYPPVAYGDGGDAYEMARPLR